MSRISEAAVIRSQGERYGTAADRPSERRAAEPSDASAGVPVQLRAESVVRATKDDGTEIATVVGLASVTEQGYEMFDWAGPYTEIVSLDAFDSTLASSPLVEFTLNHNRGGGLPMAHTRNGTLTLEATKEPDADGFTGLRYEAVVDPTRSDVADMLKALDRGDLAEASFKFRIVKGQWSPDYEEFRINETDLHRGDVSAVNFGANPLATSGVRAAEAAPAVPASAPRAVFISEDDTRRRSLHGR